MRRNGRVMIYFGLWTILAILVVVLNFLNVNWNTTNSIQGILIVIILGILQGSVLEFPIQTLTTLAMGGNVRRDKKGNAGSFTIILNYNLLATNQDDIEECFETMYEAYMGNLSTNVSAVLVSATGKRHLKDYELKVRDRYRAVIYDTLYKEGVAFSRGEFHRVDHNRLEHTWKQWGVVDSDAFVRDFLYDICNNYSKEFMVIHRVSRVLRKCGQYQDLMLLSEGDNEAYSYTDKTFYSNAARELGEPLFHDSEDVKNIFGRKFHYTLVLDADTGVPRNAAFELLAIAAAYPDKGIIQPSIKVVSGPRDTMYMRLESVRQAIYEPMTNALTATIGQCGFFGKAMIRNKIYIKTVIGTRDELMECVPIDVLSHDTFEAALLRPYYASTVHLLEAPSYNYITWNIRERRWNRGEVLLAGYFWKGIVGIPFKWLQRKFLGATFIPTTLRTESKIDVVSSYIAYSALRQMFMKPCLLLFIVLHINVDLNYSCLPIILVMLAVLVMPKLVTCTRDNYKLVLIEMVASILQFTPEAMVGTVRLFRAVQANLCSNSKWIPQRAVEEEFRNSNPFVSSLKHLWGYAAFSLIVGVVVLVFFEGSQWLLLVLLVTVIILPFFTGLTSLTSNFRTSRNVNFCNVNIESGSNNMCSESEDLPFSV